ncbi:Glycosyltransferase involved in cell wall bisynthesis [bacterium A37T11]|nr:Glycosyltransferase involved in cell wall bisynthesis [bacterium A37T11]
MKIAYLSTYPPRACGIATFNANLFEAIASDPAQRDSGSFVVAIHASGVPEKGYYPPEVKQVIRQHEQQDYLNASEFINKSGAETCIIQHEYGIYGGDNGLYILSLINQLSIPCISILHTVLREPSYIQLNIIREIARKSASVVVMSKKAIGFLASIYQVSPEKTQLIEHGVPDLDPGIAKGKNPYSPGHRALLTFGLIGRNKGLETVIRALPEIVKEHPDVMYYIVGNTHPDVIKHSGEEYREFLEGLAVDLEVSAHVTFINKFLSEKELFSYLSWCTLYITPYLDEAQITSGTLSYAIGAGAAVISTPYWHAQELLADGRGELFGFKDSVSLANKVNVLLSNTAKLNSLKNKAFNYGLNLRWPQIGKQYLKILADAVIQQKHTLKQRVPVINLEEMPLFTLDHVFRLTDDTGIIQHAKYGIPNLKEGYCMDDNARALIAVLMVYNQDKNTEGLKLLPIYLSFIQYMQREDGNFRNFLSFKREYLDEVGSEDSFGRTIWSLGYLIHHAPNNSYREFAYELFRYSVPHFKKLVHLRGIADTLIGLHHYLQVNKHDKEILAQSRELATVLMKSYEQNRDRDWHWFEEKMTYDNAILPLALLCFYETTGDQQAYAIAMESTDFLTSKTLKNGVLTPVGNNGWLNKDGDMAVYDQQAIETMAMVLLYSKAWEITGDNNYILQMYTCYQWFLGNNSLHMPLYDEETGGCCDGLQVNGVNRNQGAESSLAYLISHLTVLAANAEVIEDSDKQTGEQKPVFSIPIKRIQTTSAFNLSSNKPRFTVAKEEL